MTTPKLIEAGEKRIAEYTSAQWRAEYERVARERDEARREVERLRARIDALRMELGSPRTDDPAWWMRLRDALKGAGR